MESITKSPMNVPGTKECRLSDNVKHIRSSYKINHVKMESEITAGKTLTDVRIQGDIFHGDMLSSLLYVKAMMPLN